MIVTSLREARAAVSAAAAAGSAVTLVSPPSGAASLGAAAFREIVAEAARDHPKTPVCGILDCADDPSLAMQALRQGIRAVRLKASPTVQAKIAEIAAHWGAEVVDDTGPALDLTRASDPDIHLEDWFRKNED